MPLYPPSPWPAALPKIAVSTVMRKEQCCNKCCSSSCSLLSGFNAVSLAECNFLWHCFFLWHCPGLEDCTPPHKGYILAGHPPPCACRLPQELAGWRVEAQSGEPHSGGCPAMQAGVRVRSAGQNICHRCAIEPIVSGIDTRANAYQVWTVLRGSCMLCTTLLFAELLPGLKGWSGLCNLLV